MANLFFWDWDVSAQTQQFRNNTSQKSMLGSETVYVGDPNPGTKKMFEFWSVTWLFTYLSFLACENAINLPKWALERIRLRNSEIF